MKATDLGLAFLTEDRKGAGPLSGSAREGECHHRNPRSALPERVHSSPRRRRAVAQDYTKKLRIQTPSLARLVRYLSGGNQQKVVLAKWLATQAKILILDEPTRGIDVGAKQEIHRLIDEMVMEGIPVLMISSELPEILGMSDRVYVMHEGRISAEYSRSEATQEKILKSAMGRS